LLPAPRSVAAQDTATASLVDTSARGRLSEFYERKQQRHGFARFVEQAEIRRLAPTNLSDLFRSVPGITIRAASSGGNTIRIRGCQPTVWVDGQRIPGAELDELAKPTDIGGIEFYASSAGIPPRYLDPSNRLCGLILVWTRSQ
jgi:outer membrane receptor for ferrienterochelin and colicin